MTKQTKIPAHMTIAADGRVTLWTVPGGGYTSTARGAEGENEVSLFAHRNGYAIKSKTIEGFAPRVGDMILLAYGNGTQAARVLAISAKGALTVRRGSVAMCVTDPNTNSKREEFCWWAASKLKIGDLRILGALPDSDRRRHLPGFDVAESEFTAA